MGTNSMHVAKTGLNAQQRRMQVIANNLANVNTTGFKRERVNFRNTFISSIKSSGEQTSADTNLTSAFSVGTGVRIVNADKLFSQGSIVSTDNALDLAVDGSGFFKFYYLMEELVLLEMELSQEIMKEHLQRRVDLLFNQKL